MYTRPAGNAVNFTSAYPGGEGYAPPAGGTIALNFGAAYTAPSGDLVVLQFGGTSEYMRPPGNATNFVWIVDSGGRVRVVWFVVNC